MTFERIVTRLRRPDARRFAAFLLSGGLAAAMNVVSRALLGHVMPYEPAVILAYGIGMTTAFVLARTFVFSGMGRRLHVEYARFALVNAAALVQVFAVSVLLARAVFPAIGLVSHAETLAHAIAVLSPVLASYQGHKRFSFA